MENINMFTFKHPKYYKELRERNKLDQAISTSGSTECSDKRAPDPGQPGSGSKQQAPSSKQQAPGTKLQKKI